MSRISAPKLPAGRLRQLLLVAVVLVAGCATAAPKSAPASPVPAPQPAPAAAPSPAPDQVLATVGGESITIEEFTREMAHRGGRQPGQFSTVEQKQALLDEMIRTRAVVAAARAAGVDADLEFRAAFERMLAAAYLRTELDPKINAIEVSAEEVAAFYAAHPADFLTPARRRAAWAFFTVSPKASAAEIEKIRLRAEEARAAAAKLPAETAGLGDVAQRYSDDTSTRYTGGELGWFYLDQAETYRWGPELVRSVFALSAPGALSPVVRHERGFYFLKLVAVEESVPIPIEKMRSGIQSRILNEKREAARQEFYRGLLARTAVRSDPAKLAAIAPLTPAAPPNAPPPALPPN